MLSGVCAALDPQAFKLLAHATVIAVVLIGFVSVRMSFPSLFETGIAGDGKRIVKP